MAHALCTEASAKTAENVQEVIHALVRLVAVARAKQAVGAGVTGGNGRRGCVLL